MAPTQERLKELMHYDPETGVFTRRIDRGNTRAGTVAGTTTSKGYGYVGVDGAQYMSHRLAYLYVYGEMPAGMLDHHDQDKGNNRISNLRPATATQNKLNTGVRAHNTSGYTGVSWRKETQKWLVQITVNRKTHNLGHFTSLEDAVAARKAAEVTLGVSEFCPQ